MGTNFVLTICITASTLTAVGSLAMGRPTWALLAAVIAVGFLYARAEGFDRSSPPPKGAYGPLQVVWGEILPTAGVYIMGMDHDGDGNPDELKIGLSKNMAGRLANAQTWHAHKIVQVGCIPTADLEGTESWFEAKYHDQRIRSTGGTEHYRIEGPLEDFVNSRPGVLTN